MSPRRFVISLFHSARDRNPRQTTLALSDLAYLVAPEYPPVRGDLHYPLQERLRRLTGPSERRSAKQAAKAHLPAWCPASFRSANSRKNADVVSVSCLVFDYDNGVGLEEALDPWRDHVVLAATSWSHTEDHPKFRLVLPLAAPVPARHWKAVWTWGFERGRRLADANCSNAARLYYLPVQRHARAPYWSRVLVDGRRSLAVPVRLLTDRPRPAPRPSRPVTLSPVLASRLQRQRLRTQPDVRRRAGEALGGRVRGEGHQQRVDAVTCPACGSSTVWWWVHPHSATQARCKHLNHCSWRGPLEALLQGAMP